jgi:hypothetical protein
VKARAGRPCTGTSTGGNKPRPPRRSCRSWAASCGSRKSGPRAEAGHIDSQTVKGADTVGADTRGYDAGKRINGRKRFIVTDTLGLLLVVVVLAASTQDRDGAKPALLDARLRTRVRFVFADGGFAGRLLDWARPCSGPLCTSSGNRPTSADSQ